MEPESEKMEALQKAYAELILNTAKAAAARIMVSERKALCFQRNAASVKEDALNMLLRLKQAADAKIADLEMTSLRQKLKIEELEAQLHEAEDVVTDLRVELQEAHYQLEKMRKSQVKLSDERTEKSSGGSNGNSPQLSELNASEAVSLPLLDAGDGFKDEQTVKNSPASQGNSSQPSELNDSEAVSLPLPDAGDGFKNEQTVKSSPDSQGNSSQPSELNDSEAVSLTLPDAGCQFDDTSFDPRKTGDNCCSVSKSAATQTKSFDSPPESNCAANPDLASIIMTSKEPELYRNRCTQRIRAYEDGKLPLPVEKDGQNSNIKNELTITEDEKVEVTCIPASQKQQDSEIEGKKATELVESLVQDSSYDKSQGVKFLRRISLRKSKSRYRNPVVAPCANQVHTCLASTSTNTDPCPGNSLAESGEDLSGINQEGTQNLESHMQPVSLLNNNSKNPLLEMNGSLDTTERVNVQNATVEDATLAADKSELSRLEGTVEGSLGVHNCWLNYEEFDLATDSTSKDVQTCNSNNEAPAQAANDGLKYTFHRKRKKGSLNCPDESEGKEKNTVKKISGEKQIGAMESEKSSLIMESSRESRRLAQVARQLISLSEKRR